jgi:PAS domain-containing protein
MRSPRSRPPHLLYLGAALFVLLAALTVASVRREWHRRVGEEQAAALFQLVQDKTPPRPTETPGVTAWLHLALKRYRNQIADPERARLYGEIADWQDRRSVPPSLTGIRDLLASPPASPLASPPASPINAGTAPAAQWAPIAPGMETGGGRSPLQLRSQRFLEIGDAWLVVTRRKVLDVDSTNASDRFLGHVAPRLLRVGERMAATLAARPLPAVPGPRPPRVARVYALSEDGTLATLPLAELASDPAARRHAAEDEGRELRKLPQLPNFVSNEFFFQFDFTRPAGQVYYSGLYLDLGGQGVVATITVPYVDPGSGTTGILGADITFDLDWRAFAHQIEPPMVAEVVTLPPPPEERWRPWSDVLAALPAGRDRPLARAVSAAAERERREGLFVTPGTVQHSVVEGQGAVAALQVAARDWLVILFPKTDAGFPAVSLALLLLPMSLLLGGFELYRRRAEQAQAKAERELAEKQNLLNTMQVPLLVVDPNSDAVVFGNEAARRLGIEAGARIADLVAGDERARRHYERMQVAGPDARRAYGLPLRVRGEDGEMETRYAVVRSVAVTAPIEALEADERHRLGILFVLEPEADLAILTEDLVHGARGEERRRLAGLLSHGIDTLVRVLAHALARQNENDEDRAFVGWLSAYVERRIGVTAWLLDHWDAEPPFPPACAIEPSHARETLAALERVFARVAADPELRSSLCWDNGALARPAGEVLSLAFDWPARYWFPMPVRGGFGLFLEEVLVNAVRHGRPGTVPVLGLNVDRGRRELLCEVENELREAGGPARIEPYGGRRLLERLALLFGWEGLRFAEEDGRFLVSWRIPVSEREAPGKAD